MLGEVVEFAQVRDYSLQVLQKLSREQRVSEMCVGSSVPSSKHPRAAPSCSKQQERQGAKSHPGIK